MSEARRVPLAEALPGGADIYPLPADEQVVAAFVLVKTRDADGRPDWHTRVTHDYNRMEFLGALVTYVDSLRREEAASWTGEDEDAPHSHPDIDT